VVAQIVDLIRPSQAEIEDLAARETQLATLSGFSPICRGPVFAVAVLVFIGLAAMPAVLWRIVTAKRRMAGID